MDSQETLRHRSATSNNTNIYANHHDNRLSSMGMATGGNNEIGAGHHHHHHHHMIETTPASASTSLSMNGSSPSDSGDVNFINDNDDELIEGLYRDINQLGGFLSKNTKECIQIIKIF